MPIIIVRCDRFDAIQSRFSGCILHALQHTINPTSLITKSLYRVYAFCNIPSGMKHRTETPLRKSPPHASQHNSPDTISSSATIATFNSRPLWQLRQRQIEQEFCFQVTLRANCIHWRACASAHSGQEQGYPEKNMIRSWIRDACHVARCCPYDPLIRSS